MGVFLFLVVLAAAAYFIFTPKGKEQFEIIKGSVLKETPLDILKRRYASGQITQDEFEQMKKDLES
ncbi:putative membrane protein [Desulfatibacillum alkenivorans DSM 16219]|jgi:putative membrane protein|uniref:Putative membrane protein n=1 Tax=Desulfatibacillum alkenivorans DSM 16219 TaxID=1121393 RepID=A0A1M6Q612_9BACT|nr:SHOCT domain-containing protein [Desulfatibacillum alkenivorans]SHK15652.1 putative membrane protein [Desulfatibacillum alkenivorans DSM 16219]